MKKRIFSAMMALCLAFSISGTAFAASDVTSATPTPSPTATVETEVETKGTTDPTPTPSETPDPTATPTAEPTATPDNETETPASPEPTATAEPSATPSTTGNGTSETTANVTYPARTVEQTLDGTGVTVTVDVPENALPEDAQLSVALVGSSEDSADDQTVADVAAELDNAEVDYDGFVALDISFVDNKGEKVEPAKPVSVSFSLPANVLPEDMDAGTLAVQHLAEDEAGEVVSVDTVADAAEETEGTISVESAPMAIADDNAAAETVTAEFEVDGFSTFTITWSQRPTQYFQVTVHYVDENGKAITGKQSDDLTVNFGGSRSATYTFSDYAGNIDGYTYLGAYYQAVDGNVVTRMVASQQRSGEKTTRTLTFYNGSGQQAEPVESITYGNDEITRDIYLVYQEDTPEGFYIDETIAQNGLLTATFGEGVDVSDRTFNYVWYRKAPGGDWVRINRTVASDDYYNMDAENGTSAADSINAVLDGYVADKDNTTYLYDYKVEAYEVVNGEQQEQPSYEAELQMPYYYAIQNGDFEKPGNSNNDGGEFRVQDTNSEIMWKTTETTGEIELVTKGDNAEKYYGLDTGNWNNSGDYEGHDDQIAELNAKEEESSLYQDIATVPGTRLYWSLDHRARDNTSSSKEPYTNQSSIKQDTMYVLIMSAKEADELLTAYRGDTAQEKVRNYIDDNPDALNEYIWEILDDAEWDNHSGDYVVPENQFLTRFFFVAGDTVFSGLPDKVQDQYDSTAQPKSVGNFIDNVTFDKNVPPPSAQHGNLQITKQIVGIQYLPGDYQVEFTLSKDGESIDTVTIQATEFENNVAGVTILNLEPGEYTITETDVSTVEGYTLTQTPEPQTITVTAGQTAEAIFINTYEDQSSTEPVVSDPTIRKYVDDKEDGTYDLSLDVTGTTGKEEIPINVLYVLDESYSMMWTMDGDYPDKGTGRNPSGDNKYPENGNNEAESPYNYSYVRFNAAKQAIDRLNSVLKADENLDVQVALVTFAQDNENPDEYYKGKYISWNDLKTNTLELPASEWETFASGTNYHDALTQAQNMISDLHNEREDAETIVVFVTDGEPNWPRQSGNGNYAKEQAAAAMGALDCDRFYAVGVGSDIGNEYLAELILNAKDGVETASFQSGDTTALVNYFNGIAADIAGTDTHNVTIVDELSEYAELTHTTAIPQIEIQKDDGTFVTVYGPINENEPDENGIVTYQYSFTDKTDASSTSETEQKLTYTYYPANTYGESKDNTYPVITLDFPKDYALTKDWTYTITLPIRPTAAASTYLSEHNGAYPEGHIGEQDSETGIITDVPDSSEEVWTSTGKAGFFSNTEATLKYDSNDTTNQEKTYLKPVIQVKTGTLTITKEISGVRATTTQPFVFTITTNNASVSGNTYTTSVDGTSVAFSKAENEQGLLYTATISLGAKSVENGVDGAITVNGLPAGSYTVQENTSDIADIGDYYFDDESYTGTKDKVTVNTDTESDEPISATASVSAGADTQVDVTNTYKPYLTLTVEKDVTGEMGNTDEFFSFTVKKTNTGAALTADDITNNNVPDDKETPDVDEAEVYVKNVQQGTGQSTVTLEMKDSGQIVIGQIKDSDVIQISETAAAGYNTTIDLTKVDGYTPGTDGATHAGFVTTQGSAQVTVTVADVQMDEGNNSLGTIRYDNHRGVVAPTGLEFNHTAPYALMVTAAGVAGLALLGSMAARRRRRQE